MNRIKLLILKILIRLLRPFSPRLNRDLKQGKNILFIRNDGLGDFLLFLPAAKLYRRAFPDHRLILFCSAVAPLAQQCGLFDEVIEIPHTRFRPDWKTLLLFSVFPAEILINTLHGRNAQTDLFAMVSPAKRKICFSRREEALPDVEKIAGYERFYTQTLLFRKGMLIRKLHCDVVRMLCPEIKDLCDELPEFPVAEKQPLAASYYVLVPGAEDSRRMWGVPAFREIVFRLREKFPHLIPVVTGTEKEWSLGEQILSGSPDGLNLCGKLSLPDLGAVLKQAEFTIGNETGGTHFSAILRTETFVILGGGHYGIYMPDPENPFYHCFTAEDRTCFNCCWHCRKECSGIYPCISSIPVDAVVQAILKARKKENLKFF